jgi:hypothetical protein
MESKIQVAETGNKRSTLSNADVNQAILDISQWFKTNATEYYTQHMSNGGASSEKVASIGAPDHLKILLEKFDGGF